MAQGPIGVIPKYLRATYLAEQEMLLKETRGTKLYYFPGPILLLIVFLGLDWAVLAVRYPSLPAVPYLTAAIQRGVSSAGSSLETYLIDVFAVLTLVVLLFLLVRYLYWQATVYAVTNARVIVQKGIISRDFEEIPVNQVRGIDVHQTAFERLLGYGTVTVSSEGGRTIGNEAWRGVPKPFQFQRLVESATQAQRSGPAPSNWSGGSTMIRPPGSM